MAVTRPLKEGSTTTYQAKVAAGFPDILASEVDADLDTIYAAWNGNVGTANLIDGAVTTAKLADSAVTSVKIADGAIATVDLAAGAVTWPKLSLQTYARVFRGSSQQSIASGASTVLSYDTINVNVGGLYSAGTPDRFTIQQAGLYVFGGGFGFPPTGGGASRTAYLSTTGGGTVAVQTGAIAPNVVNLTVATLMSLSAGEVVQLNAVQDSGAAILTATGTALPHLWIARVA
jgi:hypothetical protein